MRNYCKCGNKSCSTYTPYLSPSKLCCSECFNEIKQDEAREETKPGTIKVETRGEDVCVIKDGVIIEYFNVFAEDYAHTLAERCASKLRLEQKDMI